jgi:hypothetical protein
MSLTARQQLGVKCKCGSPYPKFIDWKGFPISFRYNDRFNSLKEYYQFMISNNYGAFGDCSECTENRIKKENT